MSTCCSSGCGPAPTEPRFRRALWIAFVINAAMFAVELSGGLRADSASLLADAADFLGDTANYAISLVALSMAAVWRSRAALLKGASMGIYGIAVIALAAFNFMRDAAPEPATMGVIGLLALLANVSVAVMLFKFRGGDANMQSVWVCSRNDAIGNVAVVLAAVGVFGTGSAGPDLLVALVMASLAITGSARVVRQALEELSDHRNSGAAASTGA